MATSSERLKRNIAFLLGLLECALFGGCIFGWAALVYVLKEDGVYSHFCNGGNGTDELKDIMKIQLRNTSLDASVEYDVRTARTNHTVASFHTASFPTCQAQDEMLNLCFTVTIFAMGGCQFFIGWAMDSLGIRVCRVTGMTLYIFGCLMIGFATAELPWLIFPGCCFLSLGGMLFFMTNFQIGNYFEAFQLSVLTIYNAAIDTSGTTFLFLKLLYEIGFQRSHCFIFLAGLSFILIGTSTFILLPKSSVIPRSVFKLHHMGDDIVIEGGEGISSRKQSRVDVAPRRKESKVGDGVDFSGSAAKRRGTVFDDGLTAPFHHYVLTRVFVCQLIWQGLYQLRLIYFMGSLNVWIRRVTDNQEEEVSRFTNAASVMWICAVVGGPIEGLILHFEKQRIRRGEMTEYDHIRPAAIPQAIGTTIILILSVLVLFPVKELLYVQFVLMVLCKNFLYGLSFAFVVMAFPIRHFGKISGLMFCINSAVSALQFPLFIWARESSTTVDIFLLCLVLVTYLQPIHLAIGDRFKG